MSNEVKLRMNAYYYSFGKTGVLEIDRILSAVACAGKAYHNTSQWNDDTGFLYEGHTGACPIEWIETASTLAAESFKKETARADAAEGCVKRCIEYLREIGTTTRGESTFPSADYADAIADDLEVLLEKKP